MSDSEAMLNVAYETYEGSEMAKAYSTRHGIESAAILTVHDDETSHLVFQYVAPKIEGKTVIEIGGGIGLLALHLGTVAKRVYCIEANPIWSSTFIAVLLRDKPKNVSYLFGSADEFAGQIKGDVALFCAHSGIKAMREAAAMFAPVVIDVYGDLIAENPAAFDSFARTMRS